MSSMSEHRMLHNLYCTLRLSKIFCVNRMCYTHSNIATENKYIESSQLLPIHAHFDCTSCCLMTRFKWMTRMDYAQNACHEVPHIGRWQTPCVHTQACPKSHPIQSSFTKHTAAFITVLSIKSSTIDGIHIFFVLFRHSFKSFSVQFVLHVLFWFRASGFPTTTTTTTCDCVWFALCVNIVCMICHM